MASFEEPGRQGLGAPRVPDYILLGLGGASLWWERRAAYGSMARRVGSIFNYYFPAEPNSQGPIINNKKSSNRFGCATIFNSG